MTKPNSEYRAQAKQLMEGKYAEVIVILLITGAVSALTGISAIIPILLMAAFTFAFTKMYVQVTENKVPDLKDILFVGFQENYVRNLICFLLRALYTFLWGLLLWIPGIIKAYAYSMAFFLMYKEPGLTGDEAITKSRLYMNGHKMDLFLLQLSYIGWFFLSLFTFGILMLWIMPKVQTATMLFFEDIYQEKNPQPVVESI